MHGQRPAARQQTNPDRIRIQNHGRPSMQYGKSLSTQNSAATFVWLRVYCGGDQELDDTVNCPGVTQRPSSLRPSRSKEYSFQILPIRSLFLRRSMHPLPVDCRGGRAVYGPIPCFNFCQLSPRLLTWWRREMARQFICRDCPPEFVRWL